MLWHLDEKHKDEAPFINHLIEVAALVAMATAGRKRSAESPRAKMLTLADKTSNLRALARAVSHEEDTRDYAQWAEAVAKELRGSDR